MQTRVVERPGHRRGPRHRAADPVARRLLGRLLASEFDIKHATLQPTWPVPAAVREDQKVIEVVPADSEPHEHEPPPKAPHVH
mgnify:CR=1 FL=1